MEIMIFDKQNKQEDYQFIARDLNTNKLVIGYVVIEKQWYGKWKYYVFQNEYGTGGMCGGSTDLGLNKTLVKPDSIQPFDQIAKILWNKENGIPTKLVNNYIGVPKGTEEVITIIKVDDEIPYELWNI